MPPKIWIVAAAAELGCVGGGEVGRERLELGVGAALVDGDRCEQRLGVGQLSVHGHVGAGMLDGLVDADRLAELDAVDGMSGGDVTQRFGDAGQQGRCQNVGAPLDRLDRCCDRRERCGTVAARSLQVARRVDAGDRLDRVERVEFDDRGQSAA